MGGDPGGGAVVRGLGNCRRVAVGYTRSLTAVFKFDWDRANLDAMTRRGVTPREVEQVFANDPYGAGYDVARGEERWTSMGHTDSLRVLVVVWAIREGAIRALAAREASPSGGGTYLAARGFER